MRALNRLNTQIGNRNQFREMRAEMIKIRTMGVEQSERFFAEFLSRRRFAIAFGRRETAIAFRDSVGDAISGSNDRDNNIQRFIPQQMDLRLYPTSIYTYVFKFCLYRVSL